MCCQKWLGWRKKAKHITTHLSNITNKLAMDLLSENGYCFFSKFLINHSSTSFKVPRIFPLCQLGIKFRFTKIQRSQHALLWVFITVQTQIPRIIKKVLVNSDIQFNNQHDLADSVRNSATPTSHGDHILKSLTRFQPKQQESNLVTVRACRQFAFGGQAETESRAQNQTRMRPIQLGATQYQTDWSRAPDQDAAKQGRV